MAAAWLDEREPSSLFLARGIGRPLWIGQSRAGLFFASTHEAFELLQSYTSAGPIEASELAEGSFLSVADGEQIRRERFRPRQFEREAPAPVRAPEERAFCVARLAALAAI
jgi:hypothetical protein